MPSRGDGNGEGSYIAQVREMELLRRDNVRMTGELAQKESQIDHLRGALNKSECDVRETAALMTHHVRSAFCLGCGSGVMVCIIVWGLVMLLR
jgi:hypothetical protein